MAQTVKRRAGQVWSLKKENRPTLWESVKIEEKFQAAVDSPAGVSLRQGLPVLVLCAFAAQGELLGGATPFAPALLAAAMMRGRSVDYAAAGCLLGAIVARSPAMLLACALLYVLFVCLRAAKLRPNDLTCVVAAGIS